MTSAELTSPHRSLRALSNVSHMEKHSDRVYTYRNREIYALTTQ